MRKVRMQVLIVDDICKISFAPPLPLGSEF